MSTPTPGNDPNQPQGGAPQGQPGWGAPPPQGGYQPPPGYQQQPPSYQQPQGGYPQQGGYQQGGYQPAPSYSGEPAGYGAPTGQRPGIVTAAAIIAIVWGALGILVDLLALSVAFALSAVLGLFLLLALVLSIGLLVGGIFVLQGKNPKLLLYICYAAVAINVISLIISLAQNGGSAFSGVLGFILPGVIIALLLQPASKQFFASRGQNY